LRMLFVQLRIAESKKKGQHQRNYSYEGKAKIYSSKQANMVSAQQSAMYASKLF